MTTRPTTAAHEVRFSTGPIIDTDVHETFTSYRDLLPYLQEPWHWLVASGAWRGISPHYAIWSNAGWRQDAFPETGSPGSNYELLKRQVLDRYAIKYAVLTGTFYPGVMEMQFELASALASAYNDFMIEHWLPRDPRLVASIHVAPQDPQAAAREIERVGDHPQVVQVMLPIAQWPYGDPFYHPIFEAAERHNLVIGMHHTSETKGAFGRGRTFIEWHVNVPLGAMSLMTSLVCNGVFDLYPKLKFAVIESGFSWLPYLLWRFDQNYRSLNQEIPWVKRLPSEHIKDRVKFSTQPTEDISPENWLRLIDMLGTDKMFIFSTDYPHWDFDSPDEAIPRALPAELRRKIFYENARDLYGLAD